MKLNYPESGFTSKVRDALEKGDFWQVNISSPWRLRWIGKSIAIWPTKLHEPLVGSASEKKVFTLCMLFMPKLMVMHTSSISVGYIMTYRFLLNSIEINYLRKNRNMHID